jgi:signal transduction histidine kinase
MTASAFSDTVIIAGPRPEKRPGFVRSLWSRSLRVPLLGKLLGANLLLVLAAVAAHFAFPSASTGLQLGIALVVSFAVTGVLAWLALRPIAALEATAQRVARGDFKARAPASPLADRDVQELSVTMNHLLDRVEADRARIQYLAGRSVRARDIERESVARELRDSVAQTVAAVSLQIAAAQRVNNDAEVEQQLARARSLVQQLTEDMRSVADALYPGTLGEFGLLNALNALARRLERRTGTQVTVDGGAFGEPQLSAQAASALYRVADEALRNIAQHADTRRAHVTLKSTDGEVLLAIEDEGRGVDMRSSDPLHAGLGLFSANAVLALAGGRLQISSEPGAGTSIIARVPPGTSERGS